jgi:presenilin-like A22 family membrane protease
VADPEPTAAAPGDPTPGFETPDAPIELRKELPALALMAALFLASIGLAMLFSVTFNAMNVKAFQDPQSLANPIIYLVIVVAFTLLILWVARKKRILIKYLILGSVLLTIYYVVWPLLASVVPDESLLSVPKVVSAVASLGLTALLWFYPEWYVIDLVGIAVAAGAAGIFGISFGLLPCLLLLVAFAVYDAIAVYRTKHMLALADSVLELRLPIMFVVPKHRGYSFLAETRRLKPGEPEQPKEKREAMFMGLGDAVIPSVLVVSAMTFLAGPHAMWVSLGTLVGAFLGFCALMAFVLRGKPQAGLPLLNGGAILGFLVTLLPLYGVAPLNPFG